jgi:hypothetical protein
VGVARKDGELGAHAVLQYLANKPAVTAVDALLQQTEQKLAELGKPIVTKPDWRRLEIAEGAEAQRQGLEFFKYSTNAAMLAAMGKT